VEYGIAIFKEGDSQACASGTFIHVFVNRETERPVPIPKKMRAALESMLVD
jgi:acyl-CoA thioester hydrolase